MFDFSTHGFNDWLLAYGGWGLYILLALGIVGLPIPDETLLVIAGLLCAKGQFSIYNLYPCAVLGAISGITMSYSLGYFAGHSVLKRYGSWVGITEAKLEKVHKWFERAGKWILLFGYFIPGLRHLSGFLVGAAYLRFWQFALFAYTGSFIWVSTFFSVGFFFYDAWTRIHLSQFLN
jgi:membrane protein DedA with SNARE-associated domain